MGGGGGGLTVLVLYGSPLCHSGVCKDSVAVALQFRRCM